MRKVGKLYVPSKSLTPLDRVREALAEAEQVLSNMRGAGPEAVQLLHLLDQIARDLETLDQEDVDVRVERSRFEMITSRLERRKGRFLKEAGSALEPAREQVGPEPSHAWWYLDRTASRQRRRTLLRVGAAATAVLAVLTVAWLAYERFIAPPPSVRQALRHVDAGQELVAEGAFDTALEDFEKAAQLTPENPEPWLWQGVLLDGLNEPGEARNAFDVAQSLYDTTFDFYLNRGRVYMQAGQLEKAEADTDRAIDQSAESGWSYYLRASIRFRMGDYDRALADLDRAAELADEAGDTQLEALARTQRAQLLQMAPAPDSTP
jgi:tetratricopeptide (TPR) repeat protein